MSSMVLDGAAPRSRSTDPVTSVDAGRSVNLEGSQYFVLEVLAVWGPFADHELNGFVREHGYGSWSEQRLRSARSELVEAGLVVDTGVTRKTPSGRAAKVWEVAQ